VQVFQEVPRLLVAQVVKKLLLLIRSEVGRGVCRGVTGNGPEQEDALVLLETEEQVRDVGRRHFGQHPTQLSPVAGRNVLPDVRLEFRE
jgi:hypothetical protein